jgi:hypothetical protein
LDCEFPQYWIRVVPEMQEWKVGGGKEKGAAREREGVLKYFIFIQ